MKNVQERILSQLFFKGGAIDEETVLLYVLQNSPEEFLASAFKKEGDVDAKGFISMIENKNLSKAVFQPLVDAGVNFSRKVVDEHDMEHPLWGLMLRRKNSSPDLMAEVIRSRSEEEIKKFGPEYIVDICKEYGAYNLRPFAERGVICRKNDAERLGAAFCKTDAPLPTILVDVFWEGLDESGVSKEKRLQLVEKILKGAMDFSASPSETRESNKGIIYELLNKGLAEEGLNWEAVFEKTDIRRAENAIKRIQEDVLSLEDERKHKGIVSELFHKIKAKQQTEVAKKVRVSL